MNTTLTFSQNANTIFEQRKLNRKLRLLVNIRKINELISDDYINNDHTLSTNTLKVADQGSLELSAFNFANSKFACRRSAQGLKRSLSVFSSFMREYLDTLIEANLWERDVNDIQIAANDSAELIENMRAVIKSIREGGLKSTNETCHSSVAKVEYFCRIITSDVAVPQRQKFIKILAKIQFPN